MSLVLSGLETPAAQAAAPSSGKVGPGDPVVRWTGPFAPVPFDNPIAPPPLACQDRPRFACDQFELKVDVPEAYWETHIGGVAIEISWESAANDFDLYVFNEAGRQVASSESEVEGGAGTSERVFLPRASGSYRVATRYDVVFASDYAGVATFSSKQEAVPPPPPPKGAGAVFVQGRALEFAPATIASAHFLGGEPHLTVERTLPQSATGALDPQRIFVDWPLGIFSASGQLARSQDGGASFRLIFDPMCARLSRPTCATLGGGDTQAEVNPFTGAVYFTDLEGVSVPNVDALPIQQAVATSNDHGDTFSVARQFAVTNATIPTDRQWIAPTDGRAVAGVGPVQAFISYRNWASHNGASYVQGIDEDGVPIPQPVPQILEATRLGPLVVDTTDGPGRGWIYQPVAGAAGLSVSTARSSDYMDPRAWQQNKVSDDDAHVFPWMALDSRGNAYITWVELGTVYYSYSLIGDPANDPAKGGRPGTRWSPQLRVSAPWITSAIFPAVTAGDPGRIAIAYLGTEDFEGSSGEAPPATRWHAHVGVLTNALGRSGPPLVHTGSVSHRVMHTGAINCGFDTGCPPTADDSLLDFIDVGHDEDGRVAVAFADNHSMFASVQTAAGAKTRPFPHFAKQTWGPSLLAERPPVDVEIPLNARADPAGDATWPNTAAGKLLPSLDLLGASLRLEEGDLVARIPLARSGTESMKSDLDAYNDSGSSGSAAERLQYVLRFSTASEIYHLSMEFRADGSRRAFGGRLDTNDRLAVMEGLVTRGAGYHTDPNFPVEANVADDTLTLRAPARAFDLSDGAQLFSVTAFAMAGPREEDERDITNVMRTVDSTPPFDALLGAPDAATLVEVSPREAIHPPGSTQTVTAIVTGSSDQAVPDVPVDWKSIGVGGLVTGDAMTDHAGRARAVIRSDEPGNQELTVRASDCAPGGDCAATAILHWGPSYCDIFGTLADNQLDGTDRGEVICGFGGNDVIFGRGGQDVLLGGDGDDALHGGSGGDILKGGAGNDSLDGGRGSDPCAGGSGRDSSRRCD